jgi:replicative DNA helicase
VSHALEDSPVLGSSTLADTTLERDILSAAVCRPDAFRAYRRAGVDADHFFSPSHITIWRALCVLEDGGGYADFLVLRRALIEAGRFEDIGGESYFGALTSGDRLMPTPATVGRLAESLRTQAHARRTVYQLQAAITTVRQTPTVVRDGFFGQLQASVERLRHAAQDGQPEDIAAPEAQFRECVEYLDREDTDTVRLGVPTLDALTGGLRRQNVGIVLARSGIGKTLLVGNIAAHVARGPAAPGHLLFSLEMPRPQIVNRLMRIGFGLGRQELRDALAAGRISAVEYAATFRNLAIVDREALTIEAIAERIRAAQAGPFRDAGLGLVTIDHLHLIGGDRQLSTYDRVSTHARELKDLAKHFGVGVLLLCQANRTDGGDGSRELSISSARDSSAVEEIADWILALRRQERAAGTAGQSAYEHRDRIQCRVVKNRHGGYGDEFVLVMDPRTLRLTEEAA